MPAASKLTTKKGAEKRDGPISGTSSPNMASDTSEIPLVVPVGKPDKTKYEEETTRIKSEIDTLQTKLSTIKDKISLATRSGPGNDRRNALRAELDGIREKQISNKTSRSKVIEQIKGLQERIQKKTKDLQASKMKINFKNVADLDAHVKNLEKQVESGTLTLANEKRALQEINSAKRYRRILEGFQAEYDTVERDHATIDQLRKQLDDPESKAISERFDAIKAELDELKKEGDEAHAGRSKLFEERDAIQKELDVLFAQKRDTSKRYRDANDRYHAKIMEDKARRAEKLRQQRAAEEAQKKKDVAERLLEEAQTPAYQAQIEDCQTLVDYFSGKTTNGIVTPSSGQPIWNPKADLAGVPKLEIRKVQDATDGLVPMKKKGEVEQHYFVGKAKGKKPSSNSPTPTTSPNGALNIPLSNLSALLSLMIPPPVSNADVPRVVEDLKTKKAWYEANQALQTAENVAKAQAQINKLNNKELSNGGGTAHVERDIIAEQEPTTPLDNPPVATTNGAVEVVDQV